MASHLQTLASAYEPTLRLHSRDAQASVRPGPRRSNASTPEEVQGMLDGVRARRVHLICRLFSGTPLQCGKPLRARYKRDAEVLRDRRQCRLLNDWAGLRKV